MFTCALVLLNKRFLALQIITPFHFRIYGFPYEKKYICYIPFLYEEILKDESEKLHYRVAVTVSGYVSVSHVTIRG